MKRFSVWLIFLSVFLLLAACGDDNASKKPATSESGKIELTYWYAWGDTIGENNKRLVEKFNKSQDKIHVTAEFQGSYDELQAKTQSAFAAKDAPEVTLNEISSVQVFAKSGMTQDLTPFIENDPDINMDDFVQGIMGNSYVDDKLYALPYMRSTPILYMNTTLAEELGLDLKGPQTWDEFVEYAQAFTNGEGRVGISMPMDIWFFEAFLAQAGGTMLNEEGTKATFNSEAGVAAFDLWRKMANEGLMKVPTGAEAGTVTIQDFASGRSGLQIISTANLTYIQGLAKEQGFEINTYFLPKGKEAKVPTGGANLVMTSGLDEERQKAAWEFIKFMTATEQAIDTTEFTGYLPTRQSAAESEEIQALFKEQPQFKVAVDQLQNGIARPMVEAYPEVAKIWVDEMNRAILDKSIPTKEVLDSAAEKANAVLQ